jgi:signal transduction histidine kinase
MKRTLLTWTIFAAALVLVLGVMSFFTWRVLKFERDIARADAKAGMEETIRLALWRMDAAAPVLLAPKQKSNEVPRQQARRVAQNYRSEQLAQSGNSVEQRLDPTYQNKLSVQEFQQREAINPQSPSDWHAIAPELLGQIGELVPGAKLEPVDKSDADYTRRLASIPARLVVPEAAFPPPLLPWNTPLRISLMVAWICTMVASLAVAVLLRGALALSERRGAFVSAVTHELRTPLTTFRMYSEMLATGMVCDPADRQQYLDTLVSESDRLGYLIENVLAYARLERQLSPSRARTVSIRDLLERALPSLRRRAAQANLPLEVQVPPEAATQMCATDTIAVQQILLNLVDNACKYGRTAIEMAIGIVDRRMEFRVTDQGPGLEPAASARLFQAFSKSKTDAVPGIGLGLFLSRRLARALGGDLQYVAMPAGATFVLSLPITT